MITTVLTISTNAIAVNFNMSKHLVGSFNFCSVSADWLAKFTKTTELKLASPVSEVWTYVPHAQGVTTSILITSVWRLG